MDNGELGVEGGGGDAGEAGLDEELVSCKLWDAALGEEGPPEKEWD